MTCNLSLQAENDSKKKMEKVEEVDPQEVFRQLVLDGRCMSVVLSVWLAVSPPSLSLSYIIQIILILDTDESVCSMHFCSCLSVRLYVFNCMS